MMPTLDGVYVIFRCRDGSSRTYFYEGEDALAIIAGSDPANYAGVRVS